MPGAAVVGLSTLRPPDENGDEVVRACEEKGAHALAEKEPDAEDSMDTSTECGRAPYEAERACAACTGDEAADMAIGGGEGDGDARCW